VGHFNQIDPVNALHFADGHRFQSVLVGVEHFTRHPLVEGPAGVNIQSTLDSIIYNRMISDDECRILSRRNSVSRLCLPESDEPLGAVIPHVLDFLVDEIADERRADDILHVHLKVRVLQN